ncbi:WD40 repeat-like protein [Rhizopogon vinicolor AM-OR11-026]|uniref:WD40 repeat-like protein n=1 Tax=Rhizopogon vinicolor AM-OR11-026 TaxID=1314800 RepID=A0A1B7MX14_9AGAM|nr:WD40 repeat-like protein [Rhizopogon vinicolor AM-OR11-026]
MSFPAARTQEKPPIMHHQKFEGHTGRVRGVIHLHERIITCSADGSLRAWNVESGKQRQYWKDGKSGVYTIALSPGGNKLVSGSRDGAVRLWDMDTGKVIAKWMGHTEIVRSVCWSRDGQRVVSGSEDGTVRVWDVESGETILGPIEIGHNHVYAAVYSPDTAFIATAGYERFINIWDAETGELVSTLKGHTNSVNCVTWTADGKTLISGSVDHSIRTWNTSTWKQIAVLAKHTSSVYAIALSPNDHILASASYDGTARLWNLKNGRPISSPLQHAEPVHCVSFSADGNLLATACADKNAYTWIVEDANLPLDSDAPQDKSALDANATVRRVQPPLDDMRGKLPEGFFDDERDHIDSSSTLPPPPSSAAPPSSTSRPAHKERSRFHLPNWTHTRQQLRHDQPDIQLERRLPEVVEVPFTRGLPRYVKVRGKPNKKLPVQNNIMNISIAGTSQPPNIGAFTFEQSSGLLQLQQSLLQPQVFLTATPATTATATATTSIMSTTVTPFHPDIVIKRPGRGIRFLLLLFCVSSENANDHH